MITNEALNFILTPTELQENIVAVNLFVVSKKASRLKKLDLEDLLPEERTNKLHKWAKDNRFVAVIEKGDLVYALVSPQFAESLQNQQDLSINGKKVSIRALSQTEADRLAAVGEAFEDFIRLNLDEVQEEPKHEDKSRQRRDSNQAYMRECFAKANLLSDMISMDHLILQMRNIPHKVIMAFMKKMQEMRRIEEERKKEDERYEDAISLDRKQADLKKRIKQDDIKKEAIEEQNVKLDQLVQIPHKQKTKT